MSIKVDSKFDNEKDAWHISLRGEVDIYTSSTLKEELQKVESGEAAHDLYFDFSELEYIDSTGLGVLIGALKRLKQKDKQIYIINPKQNVRKLFNITGLDKIFKMEG